MLSEEFKTELTDGVAFSVCPSCSDLVVSKGAMKLVATKMGRSKKPLTPAQIEQRKQAAIAGARKRRGRGGAAKPPHSEEKLARMAAREQLRGSAKEAFKLALLHDATPISGAQHAPWAYTPHAQKELSEERKKKLAAKAKIQKSQCIECYGVFIPTQLDPDAFLLPSVIEKSLMSAIKGAGRKSTKSLSPAQMRQRQDAARKRRRSSSMDQARADSAKRLKIKAGKMGLEARAQGVPKGKKKRPGAPTDALYMERTIGVPQQKRY